MNKKITKKEKKVIKKEENIKKLEAEKLKKARKIKRIAMMLSIVAILALVTIIVVAGNYKGKSNTDNAQVKDIITGTQTAIIGNVGKKLSSVEFDSVNKEAPKEHHHLDTLVISSRKELDKFVEDMLETEGMSVNIEENSSLMKQLPKYDSSYFRKNDLVLVSIQAPRMSTIYKGENWIDSKNEIAIKMNIMKPEIGESEISDFLFLFDVAKEHKIKTSSVYYMD